MFTNIIKLNIIEKKNLKFYIYIYGWFQNHPRGDGQGLLKLLGGGRVTLEIAYPAIILGVVNPSPDTHGWLNRP
jgi:hypothetical protein